MLRVDEINNVISFEMDGKIYSMPVTQRDLDGEETEEEFELDFKFFMRLRNELYMFTRDELLKRVEGKS